jgi:hypothetical protein
MSKPQVVIMRKDKRIEHPILHAIAFGLTGGMSGIVTAGEVVNHAGYNARTRQLQRQSEKEPAAVTPRAPKKAKRTKDEKAEYRAEHVPGSREYRARHGAA